MSFQLSCRSSLYWLSGSPPKFILTGALICSAYPVRSDTSFDELLGLDLEQLLKTRVTGSHIEQTSSSIKRPITLITRADIARSGVTSLELLLQQLPISAGYAGNQSNAYWAVNGNGSTHVNLRGLGINRTLVLLDGHRIANGGTGANAAVDLNSIPLAMVERVEILRDGASAIYGADAVAGVVNIITRAPFAGSEVDVHVGQTTHGDGAEQTAQISWGAKTERSSFFVNLSYFNSDPINMADRAACSLGEANGQLVCINSGNTIGGRARLADGQRVNFNQTIGGDGNFYEPYSATKHNFNGNPYLNAVNPIERTSLSAKGEWQLNDDVQLFSTFIYTRRESEQRATPGTIGLNQPIVLAADHPTNPTGQSLVLERRRLLEAGERELNQNIDYYQTQLGLKGQLNHQWDWQSTFFWSRNTGTDIWMNVANLQRVQQTLDVDQCSYALDAAIPCADYLGYGDLTPQVLDYLMLDAVDHGGNQQYGVDASVTGELFKLPAGPLMLAAGIELRYDHAWRDPDPLAQSGEANLNREEAVSGRLDAQEAFVEANIPLLKDHMFAQSLLLNTAVRYSDYDLFGDSTNYKLGLDWQISSQLLIRGAYATAFRTPNIPELFSGEFKQNLVTQDPCSNWASLPQSSSVYQNCQAAGVPADFQQIVNSVLTTLGGNTDLTPEEAKASTIGFLWQPDSNAKLRVSVDYFRIDIDEAIVNIDGSTRLAACYNSNNMSHPFCAPENFTRNSVSGDINYLSSRWVNAAKESMDGIDIGVASEFNWDKWQIKWNWDTSYLDHYNVQAYEGATDIRYAGKVTSGQGSYLRWRSLSQLTLVRGKWSGTYGLQYLHGGENLNAPAQSIGAQQPSIMYHHLQLSYQPTKTTTISFGVNNIFDKEAPYVRNWLDVNTDTMTYDVAGRRWYMGTQLTW